MCRELIAVIQLKKYRTLRQRYNTQRRHTHSHNTHSYIHHKIVNVNPHHCLFFQIR